MKLKSKFWADLTWEDFADIASRPDIDQIVAILPVAAIEQHGPHLPLSVDQTLADGILQASLPLMKPDLPILILPTQAVGKSVEHERFPGTLTLSTHTVIQLWTDIGASVARAGVKKLLIFNTHGGNVGVMDIVARDLRASHDLIVYSCSWFNLPLASEVTDLFSSEEHRFGIHAGDIETSMMLALKPEYVEVHKAQDFESSSRARAEVLSVLGNGKSAKFGWQMQDYNVHGAVGNAVLSTEAKGKALVKGAALSLARMLDELVGLPLSTLSRGPAKRDSEL